MARVKIGRRGCLRLSGVPGITVEMGKLCHAFVNLKTAGAWMRLKWRDSVTILFDPDRTERSLRRAAARAASQWQQIGSDRTVAEIAGELAAMQVV